MTTRPCIASCGCSMPCVEAGKGRVFLKPRMLMGQRHESGSRHNRSTVDRVIRAQAQDRSSLQFVSSEEYDDGSVMFCFGDDAEARTAADASSTLLGQQNKNGSSVTEQPTSHSTQPTEEPSQLSAAQSHPVQKQTLTQTSVPNNSTQDLPQEAPSSSSQATAAAAEEAVEGAAEPTSSDASDSSADVPDEGSSGSDHASERLWDMTPEQLEHLKVAELKDLCRQENVKGYSKLKKDQLVSLLQDQLQSK